MPVYRAKLSFTDHQLLGDQDYSFNFHVNNATTATAWSSAEGVATAFLETVMPTTVDLTSIGVSNPDVVNGTLIVPQSSSGVREPTGDPLPGWNTIRIQLSTALGQRLHTFYPRVGLTEGDVAGQTLTLTMQAAVSNLVNGILAVGEVCDKDGQIFAHAGFSSRVQMRQLGWRRRTRPGYKRGWVPV
jgi:hypothetical protein